VGWLQKLLDPFLEKKHQIADYLVDQIDQIVDWIDLIVDWIVD